MVRLTALASLALVVAACDRVCGDPHSDWLALPLVPGGAGGAPAVPPDPDAGTGGTPLPSGGNGGVGTEVAPPSSPPPPSPAALCPAASPSIIDFGPSATSPAGEMSCDLGCQGAPTTDGFYGATVDNATLTFRFVPSCVDASAFTGIEFVFSYDGETLRAAQLSASSLSNVSELLDGGTCPADAACPAASLDFLPLYFNAMGGLLRVPFSSLGAGDASPTLDVARLVELRWFFSGSASIRLDSISFYVADDLGVDAG